MDGEDTASSPDVVNGTLLDGVMDGTSDDDDDADGVSDGAVSSTSSGNKTSHG